MNDTKLILNEHEWKDQTKLRQGYRDEAPFISWSDGVKCNKKFQRWGARTHGPINPHNFAIMETKVEKTYQMWFFCAWTHQIYLHSHAPEFGLQNRFDGVEKSCAELFKEQSDSHVNSFPLENSMFSQRHNDLFLRISFWK